MIASRRFMLTVGVLALVLVALSLLRLARRDDPGTDVASPARAAPGSSSAPEASSVAEARIALAHLRRLDRHPATAPYDRDAFGAAWADTDGNGCNQRDDVLLRDVEPASVRVQQQGSCEHDVLGGTWLDPYTGRTATYDDLKDPAQAQAIQIDHVVALAEAWISGASTWSDERRRQYANDLDDLLAVAGPTNASKGSDDPAAWRPQAAYQCAYAMRWISVKRRWDLAADPSEVGALGEMLGACVD